jgi:hypothetical protein
MNFTIFNLEVSITRADTILDSVIDYLLDGHKLRAVKAIKDAYDIGLVDAKDICDKVFGFSFGTPYYYMTEPSDIRKHLRKSLKKYGKRNNR